jgi:hypothetical protein
MFKNKGFEMEPAKFIISASGLANIPQSESRNEFEFIVGNARYRCPSFVADFLSPLLCHVHAVDGTVPSIRISTKSPIHNSGNFCPSVAVRRSSSLSRMARFFFRFALNSEIANSRNSSSRLRSVTFQLRTSLNGSVCWKGIAKTFRAKFRLLCRTFLNFRRPICHR